jgi:uncharacterized protein (TIGR02266 family)
MIPKSLGKFRPRTSESRRIPLEREISFRVPRFENFVTEYSANISATGIFVRTNEPLEPGTELTLEFKVADDWKLIRGRGRVIWVRTKDEGPEHPPGMGVRFLEMDPQSRRLIHWMVDKHAREGGETFEFDELRETADEALGEALSDEVPVVIPGRGTGRSVTADRRAATRRLVLVVAALALVGLLAWLLLRLTPPGTGNGQASALSSPTASRPPVELRPEPAVTAAPSATSTADDAREIVATWADAWSDGRVDDYLSCYSTDFTPANGVSRSQWRATRIERLSTPQHIRVSITALEIEMLAPDRARAHFFQNYRSDQFEDTVRKRLDLGLEDGRWRILEERVVG